MKTTFAIFTISLLASCVATSSASSVSNQDVNVQQQAQQQAQDQQQQQQQQNVQQQISSEEANQQQPGQGISDVSSFPQPSQGAASHPASLPPSNGALNDPQNVQLLREANGQYQYQINSHYEEKTRPVYDRNGNVAGQNYLNNGQVPYPHNSPAGYPFYKERNQFQENGNGQINVDTTLVESGDGVKSQQLENQNKESYLQQKSQSYTEYGKSEVAPDYNTYAYKRTYY